MDAKTNIEFTLGKITGQLDAILTRLESTNIDHKELKNRVDGIENKINKAVGVLAVFSAFASAAATYIWKKVVG